MEVKEIQAYLNRRENAATKTYLVNMCIGLSVFLLIGGLAKVVSAAETAPSSPGHGQPIPENTAALSTNSANRILALANNMSEKMRAAIQRHEHISNRLAKRVEIIESQGKTISEETRAHLNAASSHITAAETLVTNELDNLVDSTVHSDEPREHWPAARAGYVDAAKSIRQAFSSLAAALESLRTDIEANTTN